MLLCGEGLPCHRFPCITSPSPTGLTSLQATGHSESRTPTATSIADGSAIGTGALAQVGWVAWLLPCLRMLCPQMHGAAPGLSHPASLPCHTTQALAELLTSAIFTPGASSASAPASASAAGTAGSRVDVTTLAEALHALQSAPTFQLSGEALGRDEGGPPAHQRPPSSHPSLLTSALAADRRRRLLQQQEASGTASGDSAHVNTISACDTASGMCIGTALSTAQKADGGAATTASLQGSSGGSATAGQTSGTSSGTDASSTSALTSITAPNTAVVGGFSTGQVGLCPGDGGQEGHME